MYEGPVDCVATASDVRLVFVKNYFGLASSNRSYRYVGSFGVDVWNISTGTCHPVLPFDKYGRLLQLAVSPDASMLALLLVNAATSSYVIVFDIDSRRPNAAAAAARRRLASADEDDQDADVRCVALHEGCSEFVAAPDWDFLATASTGNQAGQGDVRLWDLANGDAVVHFQVSKTRSQPPATASISKQVSLVKHTRQTRTLTTLRRKHKSQQISIRMYTAK